MSKYPTNFSTVFLSNFNAAQQSEIKQNKTKQSEYLNSIQLAILMDSSLRITTKRDLFELSHVIFVTKSFEIQQTVDHFRGETNFS